MKSCWCLNLLSSRMQGMSVMRHWACHDNCPLNEAKALNTGNRAVSRLHPTWIPPLIVRSMKGTRSFRLDEAELCLVAWSEARDRAGFWRLDLPWKLGETGQRGIRTIHEGDHKLPATYTSWALLLPHSFRPLNKSRSIHNSLAQIYTYIYITIIQVAYSTTPDISSCCLSRNPLLSFATVHQFRNGVRRCEVPIPLYVLVSWAHYPLWLGRLDITGAVVTSIENAAQDEYVSKCDQLSYPWYEQPCGTSIRRQDQIDNHLTHCCMSRHAGSRHIDQNGPGIIETTLPSLGSRTKAARWYVLPPWHPPWLMLWIFVSSCLAKTVHTAY